jgi:signal transduction histidine kinase
VTQHRDMVRERVKRFRKGLVCFISAILLACVAYVDYLTGTDISFSIFYLFPILLVTWYMGQMAAIVISVISGVLWYVVDTYLGQHMYSVPSAAYWNTIVRLGFFLIISLMLARLKHIMGTLRTRSEDVIKAYVHLDQTRKEQLLHRDKLLSHVSHELRTPLTALHQFITLVTDGVAGVTTPEQQEYLGIALRNVRQLDGMIADLLDTTRVETGKLRLDRRNLPVKAVVEEMVEPFRLAAVDKKVTLACHISEGLAPVSADATRLRQVFLNLLDNALKFTPPRGRIEVQVREGLEKPNFLHVSV